MATQFCNPKRVYGEWRQTSTSRRESRFGQQLERAQQTVIHLNARVRESVDSPLETQFQELVTHWRADTRFLSSVTEIAMHPAYQRIIGMGREALSLILRDLEQTSGQWFWALKAITGVDPVPPEDRGHVSRMREAWIKWAENEGIAW